MRPPHHEWGEEDFDFHELCKAERWINKFYRRAAKKNMMSKEKYGTLRYEYMYLWLKNKKDIIIFCEILYRATLKFPEYAGEIIDDIVPVLTDNKAITWYKGYFEAILWLKHKSRWESF